MSGIYGVVSKNKIEQTNYIGLTKWNGLYGDLENQRTVTETFLLGIKPERLREKDSNADNYLMKNGSMLGAIDAFVFSENETEQSDHDYIFCTIKEKGIQGLKDINGDFAGAIWDDFGKQLVLFRDHMGIRPLFYYQDDKRVIFSTDIRGITSVEDTDVSVNEELLYYAMIGASEHSATNTEYRRIKCVSPGGYVKFDFSDSKITCNEGYYWIPGEKKIRCKNRTEYTRELRKLVENAVAIRARASSFRIGAELSGGLDSSVIDLLLAGLRKDCVYYSWTPGEDYLPIVEKDERLVIKDVCEKAGIECNYGGLKIQIDGDETLNQRFFLDTEGKYKNTYYYIKYAFPHYMNTAQIYETASFMRNQGVKFVFTGHGGDEGVSHRANPYEMLHYHEYYHYLRLMYSRSSVSKYRLIKTIGLIRDNLKYAREKLLKPFFHVDAGANPVMKPEFAEKNKTKALPLLYFAYDPVRYIRQGGSRNRLDVLAFYGSCTGIRYLTPYLDYRVIDFALGIPRYLYHNWYYNRYIFREAFKDIMPESLYWLKSKESISMKNTVMNKKNEKEDGGLKEETINSRKEYLEWLDRDYWSDYLDFDVLNDWVYCKSNKEFDSKIYSTIIQCIQIEHLVKRSREANLSS
ncbi:MULTISPECIES: asparagine synthase-related protein [unclassified Butyrivibrio]|uniref:asparagine synthase-related protein n=1 Tax=unclassified Butyrivibrio TaxID=2639466 RepID=UPI0003B4A807|nr:MULTISPECIES: asparagine synthase-related protein [unclassified Butyrivibrio]MDC7292366.1 asparagine synthase-related protein [Butyrivibrio sp. DSM 10294]